jgi:MYXO-CTERM domain-containing protein
MKRFILIGAALAALGLTLPAQAQTQVTGTTTGCFTIGCVPSSSATLGGLTFTGTTFNDVTSVGGFLGLGGAVNNLGIYTLLNSPTFDYQNRFFSLDVAFTAPATVPGSNTFNALLEGEVNPNGQGGVQINFLNHDFAFNFSDANSPTNVLQLHINDIALNPDQTNYGSGNIRVATGLPVPGPTAGVGALPLMMLLGFLGWRWRRREDATV